MKGSMRAMVALGVGYLLGRKRKLRAATIMAVAATAGAPGLGRGAFRRGAEIIGSTDALGELAPQLSELAGIVRDDLFSAGRTVATTMVSSTVDALADSLRDRAERLRNPGAAVAEAGDAAPQAGSRAEATVSDEDEADYLEEEYADGPDGELTGEAAGDRQEEGEFAGESAEGEPEDERAGASPRGRGGAGARPAIERLERTPAGAPGAGSSDLGNIVRRGAEIIGSTDALGMIVSPLGEIADMVGVLGAGKAAAAPPVTDEGAEASPRGQSLVRTGRQPEIQTGGPRQRVNRRGAPCGGQEQ